MQNIGALLGVGPRKPTDCDLDCAEAIAAAPYFLERTAYFGRKSAPASHWIYQVPAGGFSFTATVRAFDDPTRGKDEDARLLELRVGGEGVGCQTVFPGSVHESGEAIEWESDSSKEFATADAADLEARMCRLAAATLVCRYWPGGGRRHEAALALGGVLGRSGWKMPEIKLFVTAVCKAAGDDEPKNRIDTAIDSAKAVGSDRHVYGIPKLSEILGEKVVHAVVEWLGLTPLSSFNSFNSFAGSGAAPSLRLLPMSRSTQPPSTGSPATSCAPSRHTRRRTLSPSCCSS